MEGIDSDHRAVCLNLMLSSIKFKARAISRGTINWQKICLMNISEWSIMNTYNP